MLSDFFHMPTLTEEHRLKAALEYEAEQKLEWLRRACIAEKKLAELQGEIMQIKIKDAALPIEKLTQLKDFAAKHIAALTSKKIT